MKKIIAIIGSQRKGGTYNAVLRFEQFLQEFGPVECENIQLSDVNLGFCRGCKLCFDKGEEFCPLKDDRDLLMQKIEAADGVIFASPNYSFHISARMKNLFDRLAFIFHRPRYFGKCSTTIVTQGIWGGKAIVNYLNDTGANFGFQPVGGCVVNNLEPVPETIRLKNDKVLRKNARTFYQKLFQPLAAPDLFRLFLFRLTRTAIRVKTGSEYRDFRYYEEKGWFQSPYYYPVKETMINRMFGALFDLIGQRWTG